MLKLSLFFIVSSLFTFDLYTMDQKDNSFKEDIHEMRKELGTLIGIIAPEIGEAIRGEEYEAIQKNPHKHEDAYVRWAKDISNGEKEYLRRRMPIAKTALEKFLDRKIENTQMPTIAISCSGGGYRALLCTLGFLLGMRRIGAIDISTYLVGLSGSTGTIAPWISTQLMLKPFKEYILDCIEKPFTDLTEEEELLIAEAAAVKSYFNQPKTPVDPYGDLLGNRLLEYFKDKRHMVYLSEQAEIIHDGSFPYPIYTAVDANEHITENPTWYESTPHEIGNAKDKTYIPSWSEGRKFKGGISVIGKHYTNYAPEKPLSYLLGTCWSAFGANNHLIKEEIIKRIGEGKLAEFIKHLAPSLDGERPLDFYAEIPNYMYQMKDLENPESTNKKISKRVDAGTDYNLPILPVNRPGRQANVIFICDASAGKIGEELEKTIAAMKRNNLPFPKIDLANIDKKTISVFQENDSRIPVVIYMPRISDQKLLQKNLDAPKYTRYKNLVEFDLDKEANEGFAQTIHFQYERKNAEKVINQIEFNVFANKAKIIKALNFAIDRNQYQS